MAKMQNPCKGKIPNQEQAIRPANMIDQQHVLDKIFLDSDVSVEGKYTIVTTRGIRYYGIEQYQQAQKAGYTYAFSTTSGDVVSRRFTEEAGI